MNGDLRLVGVGGSPYTRKLRAALRFRRIPYRSVIMGSKEAEALPKRPLPLLPSLVLPGLAGEPAEAMSDTTQAAHQRDVLLHTLGYLTLLIWWLPRHITMTYIQIFLRRAPHHPMEEKGRYRDTRAWRSPVGTILSMGMEYHVIHHLFPRIPLFQTGPAYHEMRRMLDERGCRNDRPD